MTPNQAGIPDFIIPGGPSYRIGDYILDSHTWSCIQQQGDDLDEFFYLRGHAIMALDHDLMVFLYPYHLAQITASASDEFATKRDRLPRWTRTRWLGAETIKDSLKNGVPLHIPLYDYRADKPVSPTCRGMKRLGRLLDTVKCNFTGTEEAYRQSGGGKKLK
jgi:hypothetical protein